MIYEYLRYVNSDVRFVVMSVANEVADTILEIFKKWFGTIQTTDEVLIAVLGYAACRWGARYSSWLPVIGVGLLSRAIGSWLGNTVRGFLKGLTQQTTTSS